MLNCEEIFEQLRLLNIKRDVDIIEHVNLTRQTVSAARRGTKNTSEETWKALHGLVIDIVTGTGCLLSSRDSLTTTPDTLITMQNTVDVASPIYRAILFSGDRWACTDWVVQWRNLAIATLAPTDTDGMGGPQIIGVWVHPAFRRMGIAQRMIGLLADASVREYGEMPSAVAVTSAGAALFEKIGIIYDDQSELFRLETWIGKISPTGRT